jgi:hypothetical protein
MLEIIVMLQNVLIVAIHAALAVAFNKWWIVLFSLLFTWSINYKIPEVKQHDNDR